MDVLKRALHFAEMFAIIVVAYLSGSIPLGIALVALITIPACKFYNDIIGNEIKDSIFCVSSTGRIEQNSLAKPSRFISLLFSKNKKERFIEEAMNMFVEMKQKDENGKVRKYHAKTQALSLILLKKLEKSGYIENLKYKEKGKSRFILGKIFLGNFKELFKNKKYPVYYIDFNLTDKPRNKEDLMILAGLKKEDKTNEQTVGAGLSDEKSLISNLRITHTNSFFTSKNDLKKDSSIPDRKEKWKNELKKMRSDLITAKSIQPFDTSTKTNRGSKK